MRPSDQDCGCFACRCGLPYACKYEPVPVVFDDSEPSILSTIARHEARFYYVNKEPSR